MIQGGQASELGDGSGQHGWKDITGLHNKQVISVALVEEVCELRGTLEICIRIGDRWEQHQRSETEV